MYLGIDISSDLSWNCHVDRITGNANRTLGFIRRNIKTKMSGVCETAYNTLVRPQLEYASVVWDPHTDRRINKIEQIQKRAARYTVSNFDRQASGEHWNKDGLIAVPHPDHLQYSNRISRYCHSMTFRQVYTSKDYYKYTFFPLAILQWNSLPESVATLQSLDAFKAAVCKLQHSRP